VARSGYTLVANYIQHRYNTGTVYIGYNRGTIYKAAQVLYTDSGVSPQWVKDKMSIDFSPFRSCGIWKSEMSNTQGLLESADFGS